MKKKPQISIIVPIYKVERYLNECINSVLEQTFSDFELILVDDGSPDNCGKICDEYATLDNRIVVVHQKNSGLSAARNAGLEIANGDYVFFLDGDDYIEQGLFMTVIDAIKGYDFLTFNYRKVDENGNEISISYFKMCNTMLYDEETRFRFLVCDFLDYKLGFETCIRFYKKQIIDDNNIFFVDNSKIFAEDILFNFCYLLHADSIAFLPGVYYNYRQRSNSIMGVEKKNFNFGRMNNLSKVLNHYIYVQDGLGEFQANYPIIHFCIMNHVIEKAKKNDREYSLLQKRRILIDEVTDWEYFYNTCMKGKNCLNKLSKLKGKLLSYKTYYEYKYYAVGSGWLLLTVYLLKLLIRINWERLRLVMYFKSCIYAED